MALKPRTKETLKILGLAPFSNDAAVVGARERPWYFAVIIAILSVVLAAIPTMTTYFTQSGSAVLTGSNSYGLDTALIGFQEKAADDGLSLAIAEKEDGSHYLVTNFREKYEAVGTPYFDVTSTTGSTEKTILRSYYYGDVTNDELTSAIDSIINNSDTTYTFTTFFFADNEAYLYIAPNYSSSRSGGSMHIDYAGLPVGCDIAKMATQDIHGTAYTVSYPGYLETGNWTGYYDASMAAWQEFFTLVYASTVVRTGWIQSGVALGLYAAMLLFMGLMIFLMTRGKNNPFKIYTFWDCQKISYWCAFSPAIITLIVGYIAVSYAMIVFVAAFGLRTVFLTMKNLRPAQ